MPWESPRTNWATGNIPTASDLNRIEENINFIEEESRTPDPTQVAQASGKLSLILSFFANMFQRITGESWPTGPATTLKAVKAAIDSINTTLSNALSSLSGHTGNTDNPHNVNKTQVGLGNVDNTSDSLKSVNYATSAGSANYANSAGTANSAGSANNANYATSAGSAESSNSANYASSAGNSDTLDNFHAIDFQKSNNVYGSVVYNESVPGGSAITEKRIALGSDYRNGKVIIDDLNVAGSPYTVAYCNADPQQTYRHDGYTKAMQPTYDLGITVGGSNALISDVYISGTDMVVKIINKNAGSWPINIKLYWYAW